MEQEILEILRELHDDIPCGNRDLFAENYNLIDEKILDSFDIVSLVDILEEKYHIQIDAFDIVPENFASVTTIANLVRKSKEKVAS